MILNARARPRVSFRIKPCKLSEIKQRTVTLWAKDKAKAVKMIWWRSWVQDRSSQVSLTDSTRRVALKKDPSTTISTYSVNKILRAQLAKAGVSLPSGPRHWPRYRPSIIWKLSLQALSMSKNKIWRTRRTRGSWPASTRTALCIETRNCRRVWVGRCPYLTFNGKSTNK